MSLYNYVASTSANMQYISTWELHTVDLAGDFNVTAGDLYPSCVYYYYYSNVYYYNFYCRYCAVMGSLFLHALAPLLYSNPILLTRLHLLL